MIPAIDFKRQWEDIREDAAIAFLKVAQSGWYILGDEVREFEAALAAYWETSHAIGVASGLDAIEISLKILGCRPGDAVLTTPLSAFATTLAILKLGAVPVFVDTDQRGLIDLDRCRDILRRRPDIRFFVPVHLYGHALDVGGLRGLREEFGLNMVEVAPNPSARGFAARPPEQRVSLPPPVSIRRRIWGRWATEARSLPTTASPPSTGTNTWDITAGWMSFKPRCSVTPCCLAWRVGWNAAAPWRANISPASGIPKYAVPAHRTDRIRAGTSFLYLCRPAVRERSSTISKPRGWLPESTIRSPSRISRRWPAPLSSRPTIAPMLAV
jgi:hypothetical protein